MCDLSSRVAGLGAEAIIAEDQLPNLDVRCWPLLEIPNEGLGVR